MKKKLLALTLTLFALLTLLPLSLMAEETAGSFQYESVTPSTGSNSEIQIIYPGSTEGEGFAQIIIPSTGEGYFESNVTILPSSPQKSGPDPIAIVLLAVVLIAVTATAVALISKKKNVANSDSESEDEEAPNALSDEEIEAELRKNLKPSASVPDEKTED